MSHAEVLHFTPADYLSDFKTRRLDLYEHGAYMLLLWHMWHDSEPQCEFPWDPSALGSIWGVAPEEAERLISILQEPGVALFQVLERRGRRVLRSKRLREQKKASEDMRCKKKLAGIESGRVRRANSANTCSTPVEECSTPVEQKSTHVLPVLPVDIKPLSVGLPKSSPKERGSYPQDDGPAGTIAYAEDKLDRPLTANEKRSVRRWVKAYGSGVTGRALGDFIPERGMDLAYIGTVIKNWSQS